MSRPARKIGRRVALREERGAIAVIVAIFMVALLVLAALVLDLGTGYDHDRELQSAADAAALAGAQQLISDPASAGAMAQQYRGQKRIPRGSAIQRAGRQSRRLGPGGGREIGDGGLAGESCSFQLCAGHRDHRRSCFGPCQGGADVSDGAAPGLPSGDPLLAPGHFMSVTAGAPSIFQGLGAFDAQLTDPGSGSQGDPGIHRERLAGRSARASCTRACSRQRTPTATN